MSVQGDSSTSGIRFRPGQRTISAKVLNKLAMLAGTATLNRGLGMVAQVGPSGTTIDVTGRRETKYLNPFRVDPIAIKDGQLTFRLEEGQVFGHSDPTGQQYYSVQFESYEVGFKDKDGNATITYTAPDGFTAPFPDVLDDRNQYTCSVPVPTEASVLYIQLYRNLATESWTCSVQFRTEAAAVAEGLSDAQRWDTTDGLVSAVINQFTACCDCPCGSTAPCCAGVTEPPGCAASSGGTGGTICYTISEADETRLITIGMRGFNHIPIAKFVPAEGGGVEIRQILHSDVLWPWGNAIKFEYHDHRITSFTCSSESPGGSSGTAPCGSGGTDSIPPGCGSGTGFEYNGTFYPYQWGIASYVGEDGQTYWGTQYLHPDGNWYFTHIVPPPPP